MGESEGKREGRKAPLKGCGKNGGAFASTAACCEGERAQTLALEIQRRGEIRKRDKSREEAEPNRAES